MSDGSITIDYRLQSRLPTNISARASTDIGLDPYPSISTVPTSIQDNDNNSVAKTTIFCLEGRSRGLEGEAGAVHT